MLALVLGIIQAANALAPDIAHLIVVVKHTNGSVSVITSLSEADATFAANMKQVNDFLAAQGKTA